MEVSNSPASTKHRLAMRLQLRFGDTLLLFADALIERRDQPSTMPWTRYWRSPTDRSATSPATPMRWYPRHPPTPATTPASSSCTCADVRPPRSSLCSGCRTAGWLRGGDRLAHGVVHGQAVGQ